MTGIHTAAPGRGPVLIHGSTGPALFPASQSKKEVLSGDDNTAGDGRPCCTDTEARKVLFSTDGSWTACERADAGRGAATSVEERNAAAAGATFLCRLDDSRPRVTLAPPRVVLVLAREPRPRQRFVPSLPLSTQAFGPVRRRGVLAGLASSRGFPAATRESAPVGFFFDRLSSVKSIEDSPVAGDFSLSPSAAVPDRRGRGAAVNTGR